MKQTLKHSIAAILLVLSFAAPPVAAGLLEEANAAIKRRDYATALRLIRPLAEQGDANAQYNDRQLFHFRHNVRFVPIAVLREGCCYFTMQLELSLGVHLNYLFAILHSNVYINAITDKTTGVSG